MKRESQGREALEADASPRLVMLTALLEMALAEDREAEAAGATASQDSVAVAPLEQQVLEEGCRILTKRRAPLRDAESPIHWRAKRPDPRGDRADPATSRMTETMRHQGITTIIDVEEHLDTTTRAKVANRDATEMTLTIGHQDREVLAM